jgi:HK97 family phage major capsid protein
MLKSDELKQTRSAKIEEMRSLISAIETLGSNANDEQRSKLNTIRTEVTNLENDIDNHLMIEAETKRMATPATRVNENKVNDEQRVKKSYSFLRAANLIANNKNLDGLELEMHQEAEREFKQAGISASGNLYIPKMIVKNEKRDMTAGTSTAGGNTIPTILGDLIPFLDPRLAVIQAGATLLTGLTGNLDFPRNDAAATATWETENSANDETSPTFDKISMSPNRLGAFTDISKQLLVQSSIDVENFVRNRLSEAVNRALDYALINGDNSAQPFYGILNTAGIGSVAIGTDGGPLTYKHIIDLETELATDNADFGTLAYLTTPGVRGFLKNTEKASGTAQFVWSDGAPPVGQQGIRTDLLNGYRAYVSTQVPSNLTKGGGTNLHSVIFGNFAELLIGQWAGLDVVVDPYSSSKNALVTIVVNSWWDAAVRHAQSFAAIKDADITGI